MVFIPSSQTRDAHFVIINVFGPHNFDLKIETWKHISEWLEVVHGKYCCVMGDFDCILAKANKVYCSYNLRDMVSLN